jgi:hypothetical protein
VPTPGAQSLTLQRSLTGALVALSVLALYVDAKSVFAAVAATFTKLPAEKSLLCHIQFVRELLERRVLGDIVWIDTRDMSADGPTKGAVSRELLDQILDGTMNIHHSTEQWRPKVISQPQDNNFGRTFLVSNESQLTEINTTTCHPQLRPFSSVGASGLQLTDTRLQISTMAPKAPLKRPRGGTRPTARTTRTRRTSARTHGLLSRPNA